MQEMQPENGDLENKLGIMIKKKRSEKGWSLKNLGTETGLSQGYLSLIERGQTSVNITSLKAIANALSQDINDFFEAPAKHSGSILRSYEREVCYVDGKGYVCQSLAGKMSDEESVLEPIIAIMAPETDRTRVQTLSHEGEEFLMVLEGIVTVILDGREFELYPGDSYHIMSKVPHYVGNFTNRIAQMLMVNTPKIFKKVRAERA
jgi:mannose-6-phosphate isomerase-like protein (cupin superfamily)